ncbi:hypothetical protein [Pseudooceanicola sp.]|uniref:hypothetical protein n=1 Tax=Pseudooceanicola sp. TaxID=1914328 RepID=UPI0035C6CEB5
MNQQSRQLRETEQACLEEAILSTVAYRDVFGFPLTLEEIHRYLHWHGGSVTAVAAALEDSRLFAGRLETDGRYYCLAGRASILADRHRQDTRAHQALATARDVARQLAHFPHIRMIALTGSLAVRNCYDGSDIDLLCVTSPGLMWQSRAFLLVAQRLDAMTRKRRICLNFFMSTDAMRFDNRCMYTAQELAQMVPLYGREVYDSMRAENAWSADFLPNAIGAPPMAERMSVTARGAVKSPCEKLAGTLLGPWLEPFERRRKLRRFNAPDFMDGTYSAYSAERTGHNMVTGQRIELEWTRRANEAISGLGAGSS